MPDYNIIAENLIEPIDSVQHPSIDKEPIVLFTQYKDHINIGLGSHGMVQVHVNNKLLANQFIQCLTNDSALSTVNIDKCKVIPFDDHYMFRLSKQQYEIIFGSETYTQLTPIKPCTAEQLKMLFSPGKLNDNPDYINKYVDPSLSNMLFEEIDGDILLSYAAKNQSEDAFLALVDKAQSVAVDKATLFQDSQKWTILHVTARYQSDKGFIALVDKITPETISKVILLENHSGFTPLHVVARSRQENGFINLVNKASSDAINKAILLQNNNGWSPLHTAARHQSEKAFITLINKAESSVINQAILLQNKQKWTPLQLAARNLSETAFIHLLERIEPAILNQSINSNLEVDHNLLFLASRYQSEKSFIKLIDKLDVINLNSILSLKNSEDKSYFDCCLEFQPEKSLHILINKISKEALNHCLSNLNSTSLTMLFYNILNSAELTREIFDKLTDETAHGLFKHLRNYRKTGFPLIHSLSIAKALKDTFAKNKPRQNNFFKTGKGTIVHFDDTKLFTLIQSEGFLSYDDAALLITAYTGENRHILIELMTELDALSLLFKGGLEKFQPASSLENPLKEKIENYQILYKMIRPEVFDNYINQFKDYTVRPKDIRHSKPHATHKFHHLTGEIKIHHPKINHNCNKKTIKKNSTTLLSPKLITPVFGERRNDGRPLVGLLFDLEKCNIKAMLKYDIGTLQHDWLGTKEQVQDYKHYAVNSNYTDFSQFKKSIDNSTLLNEVLAEIPKEAILGIFIRDTRLISKKTALHYADQIKAKLNLDLPIYHYSRADKAMIVYPKERIEQHVKSCPLAKAKALRDNLLHANYSLRFLGGELYTDPTNAIPVPLQLPVELPRTAYNIITKIDGLLAEGDPNKINKELDCIEKMLSAKANASFTRTTTTADCYKTSLMQLKK